jgi:hydroxymethylpyrimidine/phosphomethylpyrimidine kinase
MRRAAEDLRKLLAPSGSRWVLVKGGHLSGAPIDVLYDGSRMIELPSERIETRNTHGTGCTLSAAIAALLPQRDDVAQAVSDAKRYLTSAIASADLLRVGRTGEGHGPVSHFFEIWR